MCEIIKGQQVSLFRIGGIEGNKIGQRLHYRQILHPQDSMRASLRNINSP